MRWMDDRVSRSWIEKLRHPRLRWLRAPLGAALILCGIFGSLPILGFWMIPLGLSILALDFPAAEKAHRWIAGKARRAAAWAARRGWLPRKNRIDGSSAPRATEMKKPSKPEL